MWNADRICPTTGRKSGALPTRMDRRDTACDAPATQDLAPQHTRWRYQLQAAKHPCAVLGDNLLACAITPNDIRGCLTSRGDNVDIITISPADHDVSRQTPRAGQMGVPSPQALANACARRLSSALLLYAAWACIKVA
jgi:hypothetical protein